MHRIVIPLLLVVATAPLAWSQTAGDLQKTPEGDGFLHEPSQSKFIVPPGWEVVAPRQDGKTSFLGVRQGAKNLEVTLSWSPLTVKMDGPDGAVDLQLKLLNTLYGQDKVGKPDNITVNERPGVKIIVDNGPTLNDKEAGVVYLFEQVVDEKSRWKVKVRSTFPKVNKEESLKILDELVKNLRW